MKNLKYWLSIFVFILAITSCEDEVSDIKQEGSPILKVESTFNNVHFGDKVPFTVDVSDNVPLSVLNVTLYFGEEQVSKVTIRTKENGKYSGEIDVPFLKDIPDGTATLEFSLRNITMKTTVESVDVPIARAQYPYLILVTEHGSFPMTPTGTPYEYAVTEPFPSTDLPAYIKTPTLDDKGNEIIFGWESGQITNGTNENIPFVSSVGGAYTVAFNIKDYQAAPFFEILLNGNKFSMLDKENFTIDINLNQDEEILIEGLDDIGDWWIDVDYLKETAVGKYNFVPISGKYRFNADLKLKYFRIEVLDGNQPASLNEDGTGAVWIIGEAIGKPSVSQKEVGWDTSKALCMAPISSKIYQVTVIAGETIKANSINFKFFHQNNWGGEFSSTTLTTESDLIFVGDGENGRDNGNLGIVEDKSLEPGATYVITVDVTKGSNNGLLKVEKK